MPNEATDVFRFLTEDDRKKLAEGARTGTYRRGETLFREGHFQPNLYIIKAGWVRVERDYDGQGLAVARYGPNEVLGEIAFLKQKPAFGTVIAEEDVTVDILDGQLIQSKLASDPGFAARFYQSMAVCLGDRLIQVLPGILRQKGGAAAIKRPPRTGQVTQRQLPVKLIEAMEEFHAGVSSVAVELGRGKLDPAAAQTAVSRYCNFAVANLKEFTSEQALVEIGMDDLMSFRDAGDIARGIGAFIFRQTFAVFMQSATIALGYEKPRGRWRATTDENSETKLARYLWIGQPEDREYLERVEANVPEGDGRIGPYVDRWFLDLPLCRSRRSSLRRITEFLKEAIASGPVGQGPLRMTSLAAGTAAEVFDLLAGKPAAVLVTCVDPDADELMISGKRAQELGRNDSVTFMRANLLEVVRGQATLALGPQQVIYGLGVCDYLGEADVRLLLDWAHERLVPGGVLILTNKDAANPDRAFTEHILDWPVRYRTREEVGKLFAESHFGRVPEISMEDAGVAIFARCRKNLS